ncbi:MAG: hexitol phosphatase HxpB [Candidatus Latescibacterota bacterium]
MLAAAIFDMDGLLVDSEPLWRRAEQAIFPRLGIALTDEMCMQTMGTRVDEVVRHWYQQHPWEGPSCQQVAAEIVAAVVALVQAEGRPMEGVAQVLDLCRQRGLRTGVASSSDMCLIDAVLDRCGIRSCFEVVHSAEHEPYGKPHPGVFLTTAERLGVTPTACLVFEDSFAGLIAAKAARMAVVAVPAPQDYEQTRFDIADLKLRSLAEFDAACLDRFMA